MSGTPGRYRRLLATPGVAAIMLTGLAARLPIGIMGLALVLFVREQTGSYASAGAVAAAYAMGTAVAGPFAGRLVDRLGMRAVLLPMAALNAAGTVALVFLGNGGAAVPVLVLFALLSGAALPPVSSVIRTLLAARLSAEEDLESTAFALDAVIVEVVFVGGPALVALLNVVLSPTAPLWCSAGVVLAGTVAFVVTTAGSASRPGGPRPVGLLGVLAAPGLRTLVLGTLPIGMTLGATEVILPAFSEEQGARALGGVLLAVWTAGSVVGGLAYGARDFRRPLGDRFVLLATLLPLTLLPLLLAPSILVMALLVLPAGAIVAPTLASGNQLVGVVTPPAGRTEAYTWPLTALVLGVAAGNLGAGAMVELAGWSAGFVAAAVVGLAGSLLLRTRRATLVPLAV